MVTETLFTAAKLRAESNFPRLMDGKRKQCISKWTTIQALKTQCGDLKKKKNPQMEPEIIMLNKISQEQKDNCAQEFIHT